MINDYRMRFLDYTLPDTHTRSPRRPLIFPTDGCARVLRPLRCRLCCALPDVTRRMVWLRRCVDLRWLMAFVLLGVYVSLN